MKPLARISLPLPRTVPAGDVLPPLVAVGVLVFWTVDGGGFFPTSWYPGALALLALLAVVAVTGPSAWRDLPGPARVAIAALAAYTAWSYLSIAWADDQGIAWEGANRTLLYLVLLALMARSAARAEGPALALGAWTLAVAGIAVAALLALPDALGGGTATFRPGLEQPLGYSNANAAMWLMAAWPALALAACREVPAWLRAIFAAAVVVLADASLLSESRGAVVSAGIVLALALLALRGRVRLLLTTLAPAAAIAATAPHVLHVANAVGDDPSRASDLSTIALPVLLAALAAGLVVGAAAALERRRPPSEATARVGSRVIGATAIALALAGAAAALVALGGPVHRADRIWHQFRYSTAPAPDATGGHLSAGIGGARYDYYRVALDVFAEHPVVGIGADNFAQDYLQRGTALEQPRYPHSVELRALLQTGAVGTLLLLIVCAAGLTAAWRSARRPRGLERAVAGGAALVFVFWLAQGSADWFWEIPALGGAAFAMLGLAVAGRRPQTAPGAPRRRWPATAAGGVVALAAATALTLPWLAALEIRHAARIWPGRPAAALRQLDVAADLNPLASLPKLNAGLISLRSGRTARAEREFRAALDRDPRNVLATLELAGIVSERGRRAEAVHLLRRALRLHPDSSVAPGALKQARAGRLDALELDRRIYAASAELVGG